MKVLVTGATGYIGRHLCPLLPDVRALARDAARAKRLLPAFAEIALGDMTDEASLKAAAKGCGAVVHLAARKSDEPDIAEVNVEGAKRLVAACREAGIKRVINVGSQAARMARRGPYGETKRLSDEILMGAGLEATTLLPSVVYGPDDPGVFGKLARVAAKSPVVPVIGDGRAKYRPVHVEDVCRAIAGCLSAPSTIGKTYSVGGPETVTLEGLIDLVAARAGKRPLKVHLPGPVAMLIASVGASLLDSPPLSRSNVLGAIQSVPEADWNAVFAELGLTARTIAAGLEGGI
ncbi:MAG: NAD-dependent epimerase/dehydratase family protein [Elusimicrobiota bacterium]|nr:MAG: NAD-dependent epimerase/dehydratase family protein [Elusimicrobiota bacterium]